MRGKFLLCGSLVALNACESVRHTAPPPPSAPRPVPVVAKPIAPAPPAEVLRAAARVPVEPQAAPYDPLARAAECISRNEFAAAATHLEAHVRAHPDQPLYRLQLAELHTRTANTEAATEHLERFVADAQPVPALRKYLPDAHTKLMGLAQARGDRFAELFHRGAGLLALLAELDADPERDTDFCEEVTCKALRALADAKALKPSDPRARAYLAEAYARTGNAKGATAERAAARTGATAGDLTPTERARLGFGDTAGTAAVPAAR
jgi:predicted Zn-dependent protease